MQDFYIDLIPGKEYHLYSHANGSEHSFRSFDDYHCFCQRILKYLTPIAELYAYSLLPNHFHTVLQFKQIDELAVHYSELKGEEAILHPSLAPKFLRQQISNMLNSYSKTFNHHHFRNGKLFRNRFRRVHIEDEQQFRNAVFYAHKNPAHHDFSKTIHDWQWTSFSQFLSTGPTIVAKELVLERFGGLDKFLEFHNRKIESKRILV